MIKNKILVQILLIGKCLLQFSPLDIISIALILTRKKKTLLNMKYFSNKNSFFLI